MTGLFAEKQNEEQTIKHSVWKKFLAVFLALSVVSFTEFPGSMTNVSAYAEDIQSIGDTESLTDVENPADTQSKENLESASSSEDTVSELAVEEKPRFGQCGENVYWALDEAGNFTLSGTGKMYDYDNSYNNSPWGFCKEDIKKIIIEDGVTTIGNYAFSYCYYLAEIAIPNSVIAVGDQAFEFCYSLTSISIPDSVTSIGSCVFEHCSMLERILVSENNSTYCSIDGILFSKDGKELLLYPEGIERTSYSISDKVTSIGDYAFYRCYDLEEIKIPDSITSIGKHAFSECGKLVEITIPDSVKSIGNGAFIWCGSLEKITIPDGVTCIGNATFSDCDSLVEITIPNSVTSIGDNAFWGCDSLVSITIPDSVTSIGDYAFDCDKLETISVSGNNSAYCSIDGVLFTKDDRKLLRCPEGFKRTSYAIPDGVTSIDDNAFSCCVNVEKITIPDSVKSIGEDAFYQCESLEKINIPSSVTYIDRWAFKSCYSLAEVNISNGVTSIGEEAFSLCNSLKRIIIPDSVTFIAYGAFWGCNKLTIYGVPGSYAETYANEEGIPFKDINEIGYPLEISSDVMTSLISSVTLDKLGDTENINATFDNYTGDYTDVRFEIADTSVAYISNSHLDENNVYHLEITSASAGETVLYCYVGDSPIDKCEVICTPTQSRVTFLPSALSVNAGKTLDITVNVATADDSLCELRSSDESIVKITDIKKTEISKGALISCSVTVQGVSEGNTTLCYYERGYLVNSCDVTVLPENAQNSLISSSDDLNSYDDRFYVQVYHRIDGKLVPFESVKVSMPSSFSGNAGELSALTDANGLCFFDGIPDQIRFISVNADGYRPETIAVNYFKKFNGESALMGNKGACVILTPISYLPDITEISFTNGSSSSDILHYDKRIYIDSKNNDDCTITVSAQLYDSSSATVRIKQSGKTLFEKKAIADSAGNITETYTAKLISTLNIHENVYVEVDSSNGRQRSVTTHLICNKQLFTSEDNKIEDYEISWIGKVAEFKIPDEVFGLGGMDINLDLPDIPAQMMFSETGEFFVSFGFEKIKDTESVSDYMKRIQKAWDEDIKLYDLAEAFGSTAISKMINADFKFKGCGGGKIDSDGKVSFDIEFIVSASVSGSMKRQLIVGVVPVYIELGFSAGASITPHANINFSLDDIGGTFKFDVTAGTLGLNIGVTCFGGVGVGKVLSIGAEVGGSLNIKTVLDELHTTADARLWGKIQANALCFHAEYIIADKTWPLYDSKNRSAARSIPYDAAAVLTDTNSFSELPRDYGTETLRSSDGAAMQIYSANAADSVDEEGVYPYAQPKIIKANGEEFLFRIADDAERSSLNRTALVYSINNGGIWSAPMIVSDDMTGDYYYDVCADGTDIYIAWTNSSSVIDDGTDIAGVTASTDITVAKFDTSSGIITEIGTLGNANIGDFMPSIAVSGGKGAVVWQSNSENNIIGNSGTNTIYYCELDGGALSEVREYASGRQAITSCDVGYVDGSCVVAFTEDPDGDLASVFDTELFMSEITQQPVQVTDDKDIDSSVVFSDNALFWYHGGNLAYASDIGGRYELAFEEPTLLSDTFRVCSDGGETFISWEQPDEFDSELTDIVYAKYNGAVGTAQIADITDTKPIDAAAYIDGDNKLNYVYTSKGSDEDTVKLSYAAQRDIYDLTLNNIDIDYKAAKSGAVIPAEISVTNIGNVDLAITGFTAGDIVFTNVDDTVIKPGTTETISAEMTIPSLNEWTEYTLKADGYDSELQFALGYTDLEMTACKSYSGDTTIVDINIANVSETASSAKLNVFVDGAIVSTLPISEIQPGNFTAVTLDLGEITDDTYRRVNLELSADREEIYKYNNKCEIVNTVFPESHNDEYKITIPSGVTVTRAEAYIHDGEEVFSGDTLHINADIPEGYTLKSLCVNGIEIENGGTYIVKDNNVVITVDFLPIAEDKLTVTFPENVIVTRTEKILSSGDEVFTGDILMITAVPPEGYKLNSLTVNGSEILGESRYTVGGESIVIKAEFVDESVIVAPVSIKIAALPGKTAYYLNDAFNVGGCSIDVTFSDGSVKNIAVTDSMISGFDSSTVGTKTITVTYEGLTAAFDVTVKGRSSGSSGTSGSTSRPGSPSRPHTPSKTDEISLSSGDLDSWNDVAEALPGYFGKTLTVNLNDDTAVPAAVIKALYDNNATLRAVTKDNCTWTIEGGKVNGQISAMDLEIGAGGYIPSYLIEKIGGADVKRLNIRFDNQHNAALSFAVDPKYSGRYASLMRVNDDLSELEFAGSCVVAADGSVCFTPDKAGDYIVIADTETKLPGDVNNDGALDTNDVSEMLRYIVGLLDSLSRRNLDHNGDGIVNASDASFIFKKFEDENELV